MSFIDKYNINKEWAKSAYTDKKYDIAINRMYYSLYQKVLHNLSKESISLLNKKR